MKTSDLVCLVIGGLLLYNGYNTPRDDVPLVDNVVIEYTKEDFPGRPDDTSVAILKDCDALDAPAEDFLLMARAFRQWSVMVQDDPFILDLSQLAAIHKNAADHVLKYHKKKGFGGKLNPVVKALYDHKLSFLKEGDKVKTTQLGELHSPVRKALGEWFDGLSWKMAELFDKNLTKESLHDTAQP